MVVFDKNRVSHYTRVARRIPFAEHGYLSIKTPIFTQKYSPCDYSLFYLNTSNS